MKGSEGNTGCDSLMHRLEIVHDDRCKEGRTLARNGKGRERIIYSRFRVPEDLGPSLQWQL